MKRAVLVILILISMGLVLSAVGCEEAKESKEPSKKSQPKAEKSVPKEPERKEEPAEEAQKPSGPPTLADTEGYKQWLKFNREPIEGRTHGLTDIYVNQDRDVIAPHGILKFPFPDGTIIVKEILSNDWVSIMRKVEGADPAHDDWEWIEYDAEGSVIGKDASCWGCHAQAEDTDWVFTDLEKSE